MELVEGTFFMIVAFTKINSAKKLVNLKIFYNENKNIVDKKME